MEKLQVQLIGPPKLSLPGGTAPEATGKKLALLLYLAVRRRSVPKEELADLLWGGKRNNLRVAMHRLRSVPSSEAWLQDEAEVGLRCDTDLERFEELLAQEDHGAALAVWDESGVSGPAREALIQGFRLRGAPEFNDWLEIERSRVEGLYLDCLQRRASELGKERRYAQALECWHRLLVEDPLHEGAHREVMLLEWLRGRTEAALGQFMACRRILSAELGLEPLEETVELYEKIRSSARSGGGDRKGKGVMAPLADPVPFLGRGAELQRAAELLGMRRLVTLTGPGGVGKTRLALRAADTGGQSFRDGVRTILLAELSSPEFLVAAVADGLGLDFTAGDPPRTQLIDYFREKELLLLVDNLEHLLGGVGVFEEILEAAPEVKILATSREPLGLPGEAVLPLSGLSFPDGSDAEPPESFDSVKLFALHARRSDTEFRLDEENVGAVARITRLVAGLPLGLELAASWVRQTPLDELAGDLENNLAQLSREGAGVQESRSSLRAVLDHSWRLLGDAEREGLAKLSVFRGGFDRESAAAVAGSDYRTLLALVSKSLLARGRAGRFEMLEVVRQYGAARLAGEGEWLVEARDAHAHHFARWLRSLQGELVSSGQRRALHAARTEIDNIRVAWRRCCESDDAERLELMVEAVFLYYRSTGLAGEGEALLAEASAAVARLPGETGAGLGGRLSSRRGSLMVDLGEFERATRLLEQGLEAARAFADPLELLFCRVRLAERSLRSGELEGAESWARAALTDADATVRPFDSGAPQSGSGEERFVAAPASDAQVASIRADALLALGAAAGTRGDLETAQDSFERAAEVLREWEDRVGLLKAYNGLGVVAGTRGEFETARGRFTRSLELARELGDRNGVANALGNLGTADLIMEDLDEARACFEESLAIRRERGHRPGVVDCLTDLGSVEMALERLGEARLRYEESVRLARSLEHPLKLAVALDNLALLSARQGEGADARRQLAEAADLYLAENVLPGTLSVVAAFGQVLAMERQDERAAAVLSFVHGEEKTTAEARMSVAETLDGLRKRLGSEEYERAEAAGAALDLPTALERLHREASAA